MSSSKSTGVYVKSSSRIKVGCSSPIQPAVFPPRTMRAARPGWRQGKDAASVEQAILAPPQGGPMPEDFATRISPPDLERLVTFLLRAE